MSKQQCAHAHNTFLFLNFQGSVQPSFVVNGPQPHTKAKATRPCKLSGRILDLHRVLVRAPSASRWSSRWHRPRSGASWCWLACWRAARRSVGLKQVVRRQTNIILAMFFLQHSSHIDNVDEQVESLRRLGLVKELDSYTEPVLNRTSSDLVK